MSQRRGRSLDKSRGTGYKPELLVQYDKHDVAFTAWLASVEKIMYAGYQCYVLQFNLHFMNGLSERKRFRGAKFEVEVHSNSGTEAPEMMFVRPVSSSGPGIKPESSSSKPNERSNKHSDEQTSGRTSRHNGERASRRTSRHNDERATPAHGRRRDSLYHNDERATPGQRPHQRDSRYERPRSPRIGDSRLVQGMVLPPSIARWKICEPTDSKDGIPQHVRVQAMVRSPGGFAIQVKDLQVKVGYRDWPWPNRILRATPKSGASGTPPLLDDGVAEDTGDVASFASIAALSSTIQCHRPTLPPQPTPSLAQSSPRQLAQQSVESDPIQQPRPASGDSDCPQLSFGTDAASDRSSQYGMFRSFQDWLDSSRNFDKPEKLKLQALQEFMSATYDAKRASLQPGARASFTSDQSQRQSKRNSNSTEMGVLVGELNSESELLEAWLRREKLRKKAVETCLDTASWDASSPSSNPKRTASSLDHRQPGSQIRPPSPYETVKHRHVEPVAKLQRPRKTAAQDDMVSEKRQPGTRTVDSVPPPPRSKPERNMDPSKREGLQRNWSIHDSVHEASKAKPGKDVGVQWTQPIVESPSDPDKVWSPTVAWKELSPAY